MKKNTLLLLALLLTVTPAFASGHGLQGLEDLVYIFYVIPGILLLNLVIAFLFYKKKTKALGILGWILTFISFFITATIGFRGDGLLLFLIIAPILSAVLLIKGERAKNTPAAPTPASIKYDKYYLLKPIIIYAVINIGTYFFIQFISEERDLSTLMDLIILLCIIANFTVLIWLSRKALIGRIARNKSIDIRYGILYSLLIFSPTSFYVILWTCITTHNFFPRDLLTFLVYMLYAAISGITAYYLLPKKKDDQPRADITT